MQYDDLKDKNIEHFDAWASTFGQVTSGWELDATGVNYKLSFHVQIDLSRLIIFYISIYYLKLSIQRSPGKASCIPLFSGIIQGIHANWHLEIFSDNPLIILQIFLFVGIGCHWIHEIYGHP